MPLRAEEVADDQNHNEMKSPVVQKPYS